MHSMESARVNINIYIHTSRPLYAASHCACHSCRPPASNARRRRPSAAGSPALPLLACSRGCQPGSRQSQHLPPTIHLPSILPTRLIPTSPSPSLCHSPSTPIHPPSPHRYADTCDFACQAVHTNPSQSTSAAPRGGAAPVTTAHPPRCCRLPPSISRRLRSAQGALTTA
jgi:hypothetical protein